MRSNLPRFTSKSIAWFLLHALIVVAAQAATYLSSTAEELNSQPQTHSLSIKSDSTWVASVESPWASLSQTKGSGDAVLEFAVEENTSEETRTAEITIDHQTLLITQHPRSWVAPSSAPVAFAAVAASGSATESGQTVSALAPGQMTYHVDPTFALSTEILGGRVYVVAKTSDGGTLIGGEFSNIGGLSRRCLAKLKADGTLDTSFDAQGIFGSGPDANADGPRVLSLAVQSDGRIVVGGYFTSCNGIARNSITRLNADGSLDTSFQPGSGFTTSALVGGNTVVFAASIHTLALQSDGRILACGTFKSVNGTVRNYIARLNSDGSLDSTFSPGTGFDYWGTGGAIVVQTDGRIVVGGYFTTYNEIARKNIVRLNTDGSLDTTFDPGVSFSNKVQGLALQPDGCILAVGDFTTFQGVECRGIARLNTNASLDTTFAPAGGNGVKTVALQPDGRILVGGDFTYFNTVARSNIARLNANGSLDLNFDPGSGFVTDSSYASTVNSIAVHTDGRIVAGGFFATFNGNLACGLARLSTTGALDKALTNPLRIPAKITAIAPLPNSKWVIGGSFTYVNGVVQGGIARLNSDGSLDDTFETGTGFNSGSSVLSLAVQADNRVIACGSFSSFNGVTRDNIARLNTDGSLDASFDSVYDPAATFFHRDFSKVTIQPDGRILVGGSSLYLNTSANTFNSIARLTASGVIDSTFKPGGEFVTVSSGNSGVVTTIGFSSSNIESITVQTDGRILLGHSHRSTFSSPSAHTIRLNADGSVDTTFQQTTGSGPASASSVSLNLAVQPDGHIVVAGSFSTFAGIACNGLARLNSDGSVDSNFTASGSFNGSLSALAVQTDGRPIVGGNFTQFVSTPRTSLAGLNVTGGLDTGFTVADTLIDPVYQISRGDDNRLLVAGPSAYSSGVLNAGYVLLLPDSVPTFKLQPQSASAVYGANVTLTAKATGYPQISYRWYKDGVLIPNNTSDSLAVVGISEFTNGSYTVVATNTNGSTTSTPAIITAINNQPPPTDSKGSAAGGGGALSPWALLALGFTLLLRLRARR